jgi:rhodanese-related sulfurtransferase
MIDAREARAMTFAAIENQKKNEKLAAEQWIDSKIASLVTEDANKGNGSTTVYVPDDAGVKANIVKQILSEYGYTVKVTTKEYNRKPATFITITWNY